MLKIAESKENQFEQIVFKNILMATIESMNGKVFEDGFEYIEQNYGGDLATHLITMMTFGMVHASYSAVASYHNDMLDLIQQLNAKISGTEGAITGLEGAMNVFRKRISDLEKKEIISSVVKE